MGPPHCTRKTKGKKLKVSTKSPPHVKKKKKNHEPDEKKNKEPLILNKGTDNGMGGTQKERGNRSLKKLAMRRSDQRVLSQVRQKKNGKS